MQLGTNILCLHIYTSSRPIFAAVYKWLPSIACTAQPGYIRQLVLSSSLNSKSATLPPQLAAALAGVAVIGILRGRTHDVYNFKLLHLLRFLPFLYIFFNI